MAARRGALETRMRASLLEAVNETLRATATAGAARGLRVMRDALRAHALDRALRNLDHAWRSEPPDAAVLAPIYGRLLMLEASDNSAALQLLERALAWAPDADISGLIALALLRLERIADARRQIESTLERYCIEPGCLLFALAGEVMRHPAIEAPGWIGRASSLEFVGELQLQEPANGFEIRHAGQAAATPLARGARGQVHRTFRFRSPHRDPGAAFEASSRGVPLLGSGATLAANFALDGRIEVRGRRVGGWARLGWCPTRPLRLRLEDEHAAFTLVRTGRPAASGSRWPFALELRAARLRGSCIRIAAELPDGRWQPLPDSPLLLAAAVRLKARPRARLPAWGAGGVRPRRALSRAKRARATTVIIPVYRGAEATRACLEAVLATVHLKTPIIVVDDAAEEPALLASLEGFAATGRITLLRNAQNQGFAASVNRALALDPTHDAVLLNSDTLVFGDWLERLRAAAYSGVDVGTVTPLSNSGSIASYPHRHGAGLDPREAASLDVLAAATHSGLRAEIPVGVGFCLYLRRDCLREVGTLDAAVFGQGYGEETDFCLRARRLGWRHRLAADVYVYHAAGLSFGARRAALLDRSERLLNLRHPGYDRFVATFLAQDPLHGLRRQLDERRLVGAHGRFVLLVTIALEGGVERFVTERCRALRAQGIAALVLRPAAPGDARRCVLTSDALELPNLRYEVPAELAPLTELLRARRFETIEIQHFLHLDARLIEALRTLGVPYDVFVHDYAWICPRVTLIDGSGRYCGEPAVAACETCLARNGSKIDEALSVAALRERSAAWLSAARRVVAPSADTAARYERHFVGLAIAVEPHTRAAIPVFGPLPAPMLVPVASARNAGARRAVRVALIGAIGEHKGYRVLLECAREARARRLSLEFVVIGYTEDDAPLLATGKVFITGRYSEVEAPHLLRREAPNVAWFPSVWPETWCYTLDHALAAGLPVAAFELGAIAERLRSQPLADLWALTLSPRAINDGLLQLAARARIAAPSPSLKAVHEAGSLQRAAHAQIAASSPSLKAVHEGGSLQRAAHAQIAASASRSQQSALARSRDLASMDLTQPGEMIMDNPSDGKTPEATAQDGLSATVQVLPLPAGLYLFSVTAADPPVAAAGGRVQLPAVHVGLGPGVRSDQVEFMAGPTTHGAWLFAATDVLVIKVHSMGATMILTSVRAPGGAVLSIKVERLQARTEALSVAPVAAAGAAPVGEAAPPVFSAADADRPLEVRVGAHIRSRGDMSFAGMPWAGRVAPGLWIESFSVRPLERFEAKDLEYKALTGSGFETPWLSEDKACGTQGMAVPLVGFALRFKPSAAAAAYDCEYSGYFHSGLTVGPLRNGAPCRSAVANDPLEGIQVRLVKRPGVTGAALATAAAKGAEEAAGAAAPDSARPAASESVKRAAQSRSVRPGARPAARGP